ncbi:LppM family (lipo)protein [Pseudactinotalea sp.]|uniref:LppM family (lipo)protein n=1 Tax=Pseudactinotalea sp. TaxID=1926260 RepID=UPI003B3AFB14
MSKPTPVNVAIRAVVSAAVGLLALAGCVRLDGDLTINGTESEAPDTVSGAMVLAISDEWAVAHGEDPAALSAAIAEELAATPESGLTGEPYAADGYTGTTLTFDEVPIERLAAATDGALSITREDTAYVVRGDLSTLDPGDENSADIPPWTARISVTMPEDVTDHNGSLDGRTVTWDLDSASGEATIYATSSVGAVSWLSRVPVPLIVLTALAGVGALLAWWLSRRQRTGDGGVLARQAASRRESNRKVDEIFDDER